MPAVRAGLEAGDRIIELDGQTVISSGFLSTYLANHGDRIIQITVDRNGDTLVIPVQPRVKAGEQTPRFGFAYDYPFKTERIHYNPAEQMLQFANTMRRTLFALIHKGSDVKAQYERTDRNRAWTDTMARYGWVILLVLALINVNLALFNYCPFLLDGDICFLVTLSK